MSKHKIKVLRRLESHGMGKHKEPSCFRRRTRKTKEAEGIVDFSKMFGLVLEILQNVKGTKHSIYSEILVNPMLHRVFIRFFSINI